MNKYLNLDYLQKNCSKIHSFGLGFIQIKLGEKERVHIYTNKIKTTTKEEEIHNHRYNFKSTVLKGVLNNKLYQVNEDINGPFLLVDEACNPDLPKSEKKIKVSLPKLICDFDTGKGQSYFIEKDTFHRVEALEDNTITLVRREPTVKDMAQIIYPENIILDCPFSVNLDEKELWKIVMEAL